MFNVLGRPVRTMLEPVEDVFVFRIGSLGDTLVALPAIQHIASLHQNARITLITNEPHRPGIVTSWDVLKHTCVFDDVIFYKISPPELFRLMLRCRQGKNPLLYYLAPSRSAKQVRRDRTFFRWACGITRFKALAPSASSELRDAAGALRRRPRESDRLLGLVDPDGAALTRAPFLLPPETASRRVSSLLAPLAGKPLIAVGPGSKMPAKKWFTDRYVALMQRVATLQPNFGIVVFGGPEDEKCGEELVAAAGRERALNLAGATDVIESAAALASCGLYIGNDTGTMHLAAMMGVPCVAIFTSRDNPGRWEPWGQAHVILRHELPCSGCMLDRCVVQRMRCLELIGVDEVWAAVAPKLATLANEHTATMDAPGTA